MQDDTGTVCDDRVRHRREGAEGDNMEIEGQEGGNLENDLVAAEDLARRVDGHHAVPGHAPGHQDVHGG